jgi:hypothetical protein
VQPLAVPDVLRIGVKIASAVETAHRAGVLHRDVKPSNILTTAYGHPVLSDFGIAATLGETENSDTVGLSIPWSAPEVLVDDTPGSVASEVWSVGATLYSLLAGRSPFEVPGGDNSSAAMIARIQKARPQPIGRDDVPPRLEAALRRSMSRRPEDRQSSVLELIRDLQAVEAELGLAQTPVEVAMDDWALATATDPDDRTRVKGIVAVDPHRRRQRKRRAHSSGAELSREPTVVRETGAASSGTGRPAPSRITRGVAWLMVACGVLVVGLGATATVILVRTAGAGDIPVVRDVAGARSGQTVVFSWHDPGLQSGDVYQVSVDGGTPSVQRSTQFRVDADGGRTCVVVTVNRDGKVGEPSAAKCVDAGDGS